jgi:hypothetical protein
MKIAICFFGITRSLTHTIASIEHNVIAPCKSLGETRIYCHFFEQTSIANPRTGEFGELRQEHELLHPDQITLEKPGTCLETRHYSRIASFGAPMSADMASLQNLVHQLHSLDQVFRMTEPWNPDLYLFCRPDLEYHDSLDKALKQAIKRRSTHAVLPYWQQFRGYNDRFAICVGKRAARAYATRIEHALDFCQEKQIGLHAESLVRHALCKYGVDIKWMDTRASRVRFNGDVVNESFDQKIGQKFERKIKLRAKQAKDRLKYLKTKYLQIKSKNQNLE